MNLDDKHKCQSVIDKYVGYTKQHGTKSQYKCALDLMLPISSLYNFLEGRVPHPSNTYSKIAEITEAEEKERINRLIGERRTKLGARIGQVTSEVKQEVYAESKLEYLYSCVIDWTNEDDIRRLYEERLLQHAYDVLTVLPWKQKAEKRVQVFKMAEGMVIIKHACNLAWTVSLEWKDVNHIADLGELNLREYVDIFPEDGLAQVIKGFLDSEISPFSKSLGSKAQEPNDSDEDVALNSADRLALMSDGAEQSSRSYLSQRMLAEYFLHLQEYASAVQTSRKALELIQGEKQLTGLKLQDSSDAISNVLATSLIYYESPRHHVEARQIFERVLERKPRNTSSLIGTGIVLQEDEEYEEATSFLERALKAGPNMKVRSEAAWCRALGGDYATSLKDLQSSLDEYSRSGSQDKELKAQLLYRIGICQWNLDGSRAARKDRKGAYAKFLAALQASPAYAPPYTSLGIYYEDYAKDKGRARKCFQKAFELSPSEVDAAERLARLFADQADWDLVEVVAQRVAETGRVRSPPGSKRKGTSWPFAALGVCQLNNQDYAKSIASFQAALRISPEDYHSWVGLGESYHHSGRYMAAIKAFEQSQKLEHNFNPRDSWFAHFMLANVHRELGEFDQAILAYEEVLSIKSDEVAVSVALLQTEVESSWQAVQLGLYGKAADHAERTVSIVRDVLKDKSDAFNLWKALADACSVFSWIEQYADRLDPLLITSVLRFDSRSEMYDLLSRDDAIGSDTIGSLTKGATPMDLCLKATVLAQKRAVSCCAHDPHAQAVAWYNLGWTEHRMGVRNTNSIKGRHQYLRTSVKCFKRAIELEAGNAEFWNALGIVTTQLNPKVAQHSFVRSLHLNERSARTWTNLGVLYLLQKDEGLANAAFTRGQSTDPDYAHAWLGQGLLAMAIGDNKEAQSLFTHAFDIADSSSMTVKRLYSFSTFDSIMSSPNSPLPLSELLQPLFALQQLRTQSSTDIVAQHLCPLFSERIGSYVETIETLNAVCNTMESEYEASESPISLNRFVQAKADLARSQLASGDFTSATASAQLALDLSADAEAYSFGADARRKYRLSAHLTAGLAAHYTNDHDSAIAMFRAALEESDGSPDAVVLLAQILWAKGGAEERSVAREQLYACAEEHPGHSGAITALAAVALLDGDAETLDAVTADLHALRTRADVDERQKLSVERLIAAIARSGQAGGGELEQGEAASAVMLAPAEMHGWTEMAALADAGDEGPADMARITALRSVPPRGDLKAEDLARALTGTGKRGDAQRAVMVAPWVTDGWDGLI